jgi:hypothetical protein
MKIILAFALSAFVSDISTAAENSALIVNRIEDDVADRIQAGVLNPILGPGRSSAFVKLTLVVKSDGDSTERGGEGKSTKVRKGPASDDDDLSKDFSSHAQPGIVASAANGGSAAGASLEPMTGDNGRTQEAHQRLEKTTDRTALSHEYEDLKIFVLLDERTPPQKIEEVNAALLAIYGTELKPGGVHFQAASFSAAK